MANTFVKIATRPMTETLNGALSYATSGSLLIDQFGHAGTFMNRDIHAVFTDQENLNKEDVLKALRFVFYLRLISRKIMVNEGFVTEKVQNGQGLRDEAFKRFLWYAVNNKDLLYKNLWLLPIVGSWKDLWTIMFYNKSLEVNAFDNDVAFELMKQGLSYKEHSELIKKFMPRIKSKSKLTTERSKIMNDLAKDFARHMGMSSKDYNKFKASGTAHDFQKKMCGQMYDSINWSHIPGRALNLIANSKFLENHGLVEKYTEWLMTQPTVKYKGYVYELAKPVTSYHGAPVPLHTRVTIDKQFEGLVELAKQNEGGIKGNVWCALDTSGSMSSPVGNGNISAYDVCLSLGVFFSTLNEGAFHKNVIMFDNHSEVMQLEGTFCEMVEKIRRGRTAWGGTNFMSVVDEIIRIRRANPSIPLEDYPQTLLVVSDMQFNPTRGGRNTNYEAMKVALYEVFPREFVDSMKFIWWNVNGRANNDVPATMDDGGCYLFSGFDGSVITMLLGGEEKVDENGKKVALSMEEMVDAALSQEILMQVTAE